MDRRNFLKTTSTVIVGATLAPGALAGDPTVHGDPKAEGRMVLPINRNWRYNKSFVEGAHGREFDDSAFERVVIPHTNVRLPWHSFDDKTYEFVSLYRRRFKVPPEAAGRHVFVDFEGVMTASTVWINGTRLGEYKGGYTPFSFDVTPHLNPNGDNVLAVDVDSSERADIPPFGYEIDYLTFGGIYREVALRIVPGTFIENIFVRPKDVMSAHPSLDVDCFVQQTESSKGPFSVEIELLDGDRPIAKGSLKVSALSTAAEPAKSTVTLSNLSGIKLWDLENRNLYSVRVRLMHGAQPVDEDSRRFGFREVQFTDHGFELNGKLIKLRGLDRHQTFPFVGQAMPARVQR